MGPKKGGINVRKIRVTTDTPTEFELGDKPTDIQRRREERAQREREEEAQRQQRERVETPQSTEEAVAKKSKN